MISQLALFFFLLLFCATNSLSHGLQVRGSKEILGRRLHIVLGLVKLGIVVAPLIVILLRKVDSLVAELDSVKGELAQYRSTRGQLRTTELEQDNDYLHRKIRTYEEVISRNNLWSYFSKYKEQVTVKKDTR